jgi:hypothetical protein
MHRIMHAEANPSTVVNYSHKVFKASAPERLAIISTEFQLG